MVGGHVVGLLAESFVEGCFLTSLSDTSGSCDLRISRCLSCGPFDFERRNAASYLCQFRQQQQRSFPPRKAGRMYDEQQGGMRERERERDRDRQTDRQRQKR